MRAVTSPWPVATPVSAPVVASTETLVGSLDDHSMVYCDGSTVELAAVTADVNCPVAPRMSVVGPDTLTLGAVAPVGSGGVINSLSLHVANVRMEIAATATAVIFA